MHKQVKDTLHRLYGYQKCEIKDHKLTFKQVGEPKLLKDTALLNGIQSELRAEIAGPAPKLDTIRHFLAFKCGTVWDFATGAAFRATPEKYISRHVNCAYTMPDAEFMAEWRAAVA